MNITNEMIRYTAFKLFLENGYEATNVRDICKEVNIKAASMYFYYKSKQELFFNIYNDIYDEYIVYLKNIDALKQNNSPKMKLYSIYRAVMEYYARDIVKLKFLLRYHLFPPADISNLIHERYKHWTGLENEIYLLVIQEGLDYKILTEDRTAEEYLQELRKFLNEQLLDMIFYNVKPNDTELDRLWIKFWNGAMLNGI